MKREGGGEEVEEEGSAVSATIDMRGSPLSLLKNDFRKRCNGARSLTSKPISGTCGFFSRETPVARSLFFLFFSRETSVARSLTRAKAPRPKQRCFYYRFASTLFTTGLLPLSLLQVLAPRPKQRCWNAKAPGPKRRCCGFLEIRSLDKRESLLFIQTCCIFLKIRENLVVKSAGCEIDSVGHFFSQQTEECG